MSKPDVDSRRRLAVAGMGTHDALDIVNAFYDGPTSDFEYMNTKVCILAERIVVAERHREELREQNRKLILAAEKVMAVTEENSYGKKLSRALLSLEKAMKWQSR